jgi:hypothetical protein
MARDRASWTSVSIRKPTQDLLNEVAGMVRAERAAMGDISPVKHFEVVHRALVVLRDTLRPAGRKTGR